MEANAPSLCVDTRVTGNAINGGREGEGGNKETQMGQVAQQKLTKRQMALVDVMVAEGLKTSEAAVKAGYAEGKSGYVSAHRTLRLPHVQQYMMQRISETIGMNATAAAAQVMKLARGAKSEYVQLEAAKDILDRAGFKPVDRSQVQIAGDIRVSIDLG
jgi:phage terminase small subunit